VTRVDGSPTRAPEARGGAWGRRVLLGLLGVAVLAGVVWFIVIPWPWFLGSRDPVPTALMDQRVEEARRAGEALEIRQE